MSAETSILYVATPHEPHLSTVEGFCKLIAEIAGVRAGMRQALVVYWGWEEVLARRLLGEDFPVFCYETSEQRSPTDADLNDLEVRYPNLSWGIAIASEREFCDYSFLQGATGTGDMSSRDIWAHTFNMASYIDSAIDQFSPSVVVTTVADNIFSRLASLIAENRNIDLLIPQFAQLSGPYRPIGGFFGRTSFLDSYRFVRAYEQYRSRKLSESELDRARSFEAYLTAYDLQVTNKALGGAKLRRLPISPRWRQTIALLYRESRNDSYANYRNWRFRNKLTANVTRAWRFQALRFYLGDKQEIPPEKFVFFPMHFQPEASTLVNGTHWANQLFAVEQISKALPLGYKLVVKEHEKGRGNRALWQYQQMESFYNVCIVDRPASELVEHCVAVITISGTVAVEAVARRKPVVVLGYKHYFYPKFFHRASSLEELPLLLKKILVQKAFSYDNHELYAFYLGWLDAQFETVPVTANFPKLAREILVELDTDYSEEKAMVNARYGRAD
jgi:hypothetical protein